MRLNPADLAGDVHVHAAAAAAAAAWHREVTAAALQPEPGHQVVVVELDGHLEVMGAVHRGRGWPGREVTTYW